MRIRRRPQGPPPPPSDPPGAAAIDGAGVKKDAFLVQMLREPQLHLKQEGRDPPREEDPRGRRSELKAPAALPPPAVDLQALMRMQQVAAAASASEKTPALGFGGGGSSSYGVGKSLENGRGGMLEAAAVIAKEMVGGGSDASGAKRRRSLSGPIQEGSRCSRVNGRGWRCSQPTLVGYALCEHHLGKGRLRSLNAGNARNGRQLGRTEHPPPKGISSVNKNSSASSGSSSSLEEEAKLLIQFMDHNQHAVAKKKRGTPSRTAIAPALAPAPLSDTYGGMW